MELQINVPTSLNEIKLKRLSGFYCHAGKKQ
jgi:hypothetical protein